jgi:hypothetical protein
MIKLKLMKVNSKVLELVLITLIRIKISN